MKMTKALSTVGIGAAIVAGSVMAVNAASAHSGFGSEENQSERVSELAERFNLDEAEVQTFFDEKRAEHETEREAAHQERLASLVENGTLTQEQADALKAKHEELKAVRETLRDQNLTREEKRAKMEETRIEFETWAEEQGIDLESIRPEKGDEHRRMHHSHPYDDSGETESTE